MTAADFAFRTESFVLERTLNLISFPSADQGDKNNVLMSQEVLTLQEMLNSLDFKRKVSEEL